MSRPEEPAVAGTTRLVGIDLARAIAFAGMVAVNYRVVLDPTLSQVDPGWLRTAFDALTGRAAALFVLLAGVGSALFLAARAGRPAASRLRAAGRGALLALLSAGFGAAAAFHAWSETVAGKGHEGESVLDRWRAFGDSIRDAGHLPVLVAAGVGLLALPGWAALAPTGARRGLVFRGIFLLGLGYAWFPLWNPDILHYYGVLLVLGALLAGRPVWLLLGLAGAAVAGAAVWQYLEDFRADWAMLVYEYPRFWEPRGQWRNLVFNGWHPLLPWAAFFLVGLALPRLDLGRRRTALLLVLVGAVLAAAGEGAARLARTGLERSESERLAASFPVHARDLAPGVRTFAGPVVDAEGRPRRASDRIGLDIDVRVDRERHEAAIVDARRLRRYLAATRERHAWAEMDLGVVPREDGEGVAIVLAVAEDPASELAPGSEERFRSLASGLAAWMGDRAGPPFGGAEDASLFGSSPDWPGALERLVLRRRVPTRDEAGREDLLGRDEAVVDLAAARALDRRDLRLLDQAHATSWPNPSPFYVLAALGLSGVVLGGCLLLARARILAPAIAPLAAAGRTALTLYLAHILLGIWLLRAIGKGSGEDLRFIAFAVGTCVWVAISGAAYWCRLFRVGPLEWLMRRLAP